MCVCVYVCVCAAPEAVVANELLEAIKAKEELKNIAPILDKIGVSDPDLDLDSDSEYMQV